MIIPGILAALTLGAVIFVLLPLLRRGPEATLPAGDPEHEALVEQRVAAYDAMEELDADRELGKLEEADYKSLYERYRNQAVAALKATREREAVLSARIEQQVQQARLATAGAGGAVPPSQVARRRASPRAIFSQSVERRPAVWIAALSVLFLLFASATVWVWAQGSRTAASARPVGTIPGDNYSALLVDAGAGAWALSGDATGIRRSTDRGATWSGIPLVPGQVSALAQDADRARAYALVDGHLVRSGDGGRTWRRGGSIPRESRLVALTADPETPGKLYALDSAGGLYASADGGDNWQRLPYRSAGAAQSLTVASPEPLQLFAASGSGVVSGADGTWASANGTVNGRLPTDVVHSVVYDRNSGATSVLPGGETLQGTLYAATDRGVFRSTDYGQDWFGLGPEADIQTVAVGPPGSRLVLAVSASGDVYRSIDGGVSWSGE
jgi:hypothetical protein